MLRKVKALLLAIGWGCSAGVAQAEPPPEADSPADSPAKNEANEADTEPLDGPANLVAPTFGGMQFWADELVFHDWRIQRNVYSGHCRLIDSEDTRRAWGSFAHCQAALEQAKRTHDLPPLSRKIVITLHGLVRTRGVMEPLGEHISRNSDYEVLNVGYPSTRADLATHAKGLASVIRHLDGVEEINFVAHSLGNLVIRRYLADEADPRIKRIVMLGPPNNGAQLAVAFNGNPLVGLVWGKSAKELASQWKSVSKQLAIPECEFGIIAGRAGINPLIKGEHDYVVSVEEAKLPGASDFRAVDVAHSFLNSDPKMLEYTLRFLEHGHFESPAKRQPIQPAATARASQP